MGHHHGELLVAMLVYWRVIQIGNSQGLERVKLIQVRSLRPWLPKTALTLQSFAIDRII